MDRSEIIILIVDDKPIVRNVLRAMIQEQGYSFLVAASGEEALTLSRAYAGKIHMLLSDVNMPKMNGIDLAKRIAEERPGIRILMISGHDSGEIKKANVSFPFLKKPFVPLELCRKLEQVLSGTDPKTLSAGQ